VEISSPRRAGALVFIGAAAAVHAGPPLPSTTTELAIDSGDILAPGANPAFTSFLEAPDAPWVRLRFGEATDLGDPDAPEDGAVILIISRLDGATQILDARSLAQWRRTSAYFNGPALDVRLLAPPDSGPYRLVIDDLIAGDPDGDVATTICGAGDDRHPTDDPRVGRILPAVCTGWIVNDCNRCMFTAGHCQDGDGLQVLQFNVPPSQPDGDMVMPPPEDQYAIDPDSIQGNGGNGLGNDWAHFGCFPNANTDLTPYEAQGDAFILAPKYAGNAAAEENPGLLRVTGYGQATDDLPPVWNFFLTTDTGELEGIDQTAILHSVDTTPGNSGSPIIDELTGWALGIHTDGGCDPDLPENTNAGTASWHPDVQYAFQNGAGVCEPDQLDVTTPLGTPDAIDPDGTTQILFSVKAADGLIPDFDTASMLVATSGETFYKIVEADPLAPGLGALKAGFPEAACGSQTEYSFSIHATDGSVTLFPAGGVAEPLLAWVADEVVDHALVDFETAEGWTVESDESLSDGEWELGVPVADGGNAPTSDYDGSGQCFLTDNESGNSDVDGGPTTLISPPFDLSNAERPVLSYARWFNNDDLDEDRLDVEVTADGETWILLESVGHVPGWRLAQFNLREQVPLTDAVQVRFSVADSPNTSKTEAAIDRFRIQDFLCDPDCVADFNGDGVLDILDFAAFTAAFNGEDPAADLDGDGELTTFDFVAFNELFNEGC